MELKKQKNEIKIENEIKIDLTWFNVISSCLL